MQHHLVFQIWIAVLVGTFIGAPLASVCHPYFWAIGILLLALHIAARLFGRIYHHALLIAAVCFVWGARASRPQAYVAQSASRTLLVGRVQGPVKRAKDDEGCFTQRVRLALCLRPEQVRGSTTPIFVRVRLGSSPKVTTGDVVAVLADLNESPPALSSGDPSPLLWTRRQGVVGQARKVRSHVVLLHGLGFFTTLDRMRQQAAASLHRLLPDTSASLVRALALGDAAGLTPELRDQFARTGTAHLLAVSGLHIGLVMGLSTALLYRINTAFTRYGLLRARPPRWVWAAWAASPCWIGYGLLAGGTPAPDRALWMLVTATLAKTFYRKIDPLTLLSVAGIVVLGPNPEQRLGLGYGLSFAAVLGLLVSPKLPSHARFFKKRRLALLRRLARPLWVSCVATWWTLPVLVYVLGQVNIAGPLFNLVAVPLGATIATPLALVGCFGALGLSETGRIGQTVLFILMQATQACFAVWERLTEFAATYVTFSKQVAPGNCVWVLGWVALTAWVAFLLGSRLEGEPYRDAKRWRLLAVGAACTTLLVCLLKPSAFPPNTWVMTHLYVGQGDATLIRFPNHKHWLVDGGGPLYPGAPDTEGHRLKAALLRAGVHRLDGVVLTHPHPDHFGGLVALAQTMPIENLWLADDDPLPGPVHELIGHVRRRGGVVGCPPPGGVVGGVAFRFFRPLAGVSATPNDHSLVLHLRLGARTALLAGDVEGRAEAALLGASLGAELLKVAHHGSRTSSSSSFLREIAPQFAVISTGRDNTFGFPHAEATERLKGAQSEIFTLAERGDTSFWTRGGPWRNRSMNAARGLGARLPIGSSQFQVEELCDAFRARLKTCLGRQRLYPAEVNFCDDVAQLTNLLRLDAK